MPQPGAKLALVVVLVLGADASAVATGPLVALDGADGRQEWHYNFVGRRMPPVNNSLDAMVRSGLLSDHCIDKLEVPPSPPLPSPSKTPAQKHHLPPTTHAHLRVGFFTLCHPHPSNHTAMSPFGLLVESTANAQQTS